jgi:PKD repeat protein
MKKSLLLIVILAFSIINANSQSGFFCGSDEVNQKLLEDYPELHKSRAELDSFIKEYVKEHYKNGNSRSSHVYTIPVVFHIIHNYGVENITDEQVYDAVRILNEDFRKLNPDVSQVVPAFANIVADCEIEFRLATKDRYGNCTNGIERIHSLLTYDGSQKAKLNPWPRDIYLNIWVVNIIARDPSVKGYATLPIGAEGLAALTDGILMVHDYTGGTGTANTSSKHTLTHEAGHYFSLFHTWGNGQVGTECGDDDVEDTPITRGSQGCNLNLAFCRPPTIENVQNYMDYSFCFRMFTEGQKARMHAALNSNAASRNVLWQESSLIKTGAINSTNLNTCLPIADFHTKSKLVCVGDNVNFKDFSWRGPINSWEWTFDNATPSFSNDKNPTVVFNQTGWQKVTLKVTNEFGEDEKVEEQYIFVSQADIEPLYENFEMNETDFNNKWVVENYGNNATKFQLTGTSAYSGNQSIMLNNFDVDHYDIDAVISPPFDVLNSFNTNLEFKYSLGMQADEIKDQLKIYYSTNCGQTWTQFFVRGGINLVNAGNFKNSYVPTQESNWSEVIVQLPNPALSSNNVRFKFEYTRDEFSNNLYIDNINVTENYNFTGITNISKNELLFNLFPNPSNGTFVVQFENEKTTDVVLQVFDITGKEVWREQKSFGAGVQQERISANMANGLYNVRLIAGDNILSKKMIVSGK